MQYKNIIQKRYFLFAALVSLLICGMCYYSLQNRTPRYWRQEDICYTANFPGRYVEFYPQKSIDKNNCIYNDFVLNLNGTYMRKHWEWWAGSSEVVFAVCYYSLQNSVPPCWRQDICYTANFPGMHVELYPQKSIDKNNCIYNDFVLNLNGTYMRKHWKWWAGSSEAVIEAPSIYYTDINADQRNELIFIFWNRYYSGTSVLSENVYVTDAEGNDYEVEDPKKYVDKNLQITLTKTESEVVVDITIANKTQQLRYKNEIFPDYEALDSIGYLNDWTQYKVENNLLFADVPYIVYATFVLGDIYLQYEEVDGAYRITDFVCEQLPEDEFY